MNDQTWPAVGSADPTEKRHVLLGITGSIAAYKAAELGRLLVSWGYDLRVAMSEAGMKFITPVTMGTISGNPVISSFWEGAEEDGISHIQLADWANVLVVAPASADFIAKFAAGIADSPLLALCLATKAPVLLAPAMNVNMFEHPATQHNLEVLRARGVAMVEPEEGVLACGWRGAGRMANPSEIFVNVRRLLSAGDYIGRRILITTGPTREYIDPVRFVSNRSSGKMGVALVREAFRRGAEVTLIHGPVPIRVPRAIRCIEVTSAEELHDMVMAQTFGVEGHPVERPDAIIMSAAIADYRPAEVAAQKIKKGSSSMDLKLVRNPDVLAELGRRRGESTRPLLVGFAVETGELEDLLNEARSKLADKRADMIIGNFAQDAFELDTNRAWVIDRLGRQEEIATSYKSRVANRILDAVVRLW